MSSQQHFLWNLGHFHVQFCSLNCYRGCNKHINILKKNSEHLSRTQHELNCVPTYYMCCSCDWFLSTIFCCITLRSMNDKTYPSNSFSQSSFPLNCNNGSSIGFGLSLLRRESTPGMKPEESFHGCLVSRSSISKSADKWMEQLNICVNITCITWSFPNKRAFSVKSDVHVNIISITGRLFNTGLTFKPA